MNSEKLVECEKCIHEVVCKHKIRYIDLHEIVRKQNSNNVFSIKCNACKHKEQYIFHGEGNEGSKG